MKLLGSWCFIFCWKHKCSLLYQLATPSLPVDTPRWMSCALRKILRLECERFSMFHATYKLSERTDEAKFWIRHDSVWKIDWPLHLELFTGALEPQTSPFECMKQAWELHHSSRQLTSVGMRIHKERMELSACSGSTYHQAKNRYKYVNCRANRKLWCPTK